MDQATWNQVGGVGGSFFQPSWAFGRFASWASGFQDEDEALARRLQEEFLLEDQRSLALAQGTSYEEEMADAIQQSQAAEGAKEGLTQEEVEMRRSIQNAPPKQFTEEEYLESVLNPPAVTSIVPFLDVGRCGDAPNRPYSLVVRAALKPGGEVCPEILRTATEVVLFGPPHDDFDSPTDSMQSDDQNHLEDILRTMEEYIQARRHVLVCCQQGKDRSVTVVLTYLMSKYKVDLQQAYNYVENKRPTITVDSVTPLWTFLQEVFRPVDFCAPRPMAHVEVFAATATTTEQDEMRVQLTTDNERKRTLTRTRTTIFYPEEWENVNANAMQVWTNL